MGTEVTSFQADVTDDGVFQPVLKMVRNAQIDWLHMSVPVIAGKTFCDNWRSTKLYKRVSRLCRNQLRADGWVSGWVSFVHPTSGAWWQTGNVFALTERLGLVVCDTESAPNSGLWLRWVVSVVWLEQAVYTFGSPPIARPLSTLQDDLSWFAHCTYRGDLCVTLVKGFAMF